MLHNNLIAIIGGVVKRCLAWNIIVVVTVIIHVSIGTILEKAPYDNLVTVYGSAPPARFIYRTPAIYFHDCAFKTPYLLDDPRTALV